MNSITEEMRYRQRLCEYAFKHGVTKAARKYHTNRQFVYRQIEKYDGTVRSLALRSRRPHHSPNAHSEEERNLIRRMLKRNGVYGLAEVYVRCLSKGYFRIWQHVPPNSKERLPKTGNPSEKLHEIQSHGWKISRR